MAQRPGSHTPPKSTLRATSPNTAAPSQPAHSQRRLPALSLATILCTLLILAAMHCINAWYSQLQPSAKFHSFPPTNNTTVRRPFPNAARASAEKSGARTARTSATPALPFVTNDAIVIEEVTTALAGSASVSGWAGAARALLHGRRKPSKYPVCPTCAPLSCNAQSCSGHCKTGRRLFTCRTRGIVGGFCNDKDKPDPLSLPADPLDPLRSLSIAASDPFIGCANITGLPNGCPAGGTTGITDDGLQYSVLWSICEQHLYNLSCVEGINRTPFHPFGYCNCVVAYDGGGVAGSPCRLPELDYNGPNVTDSDDTPVRVFTEGNLTMTTFGYREQYDIVTYSYSTSFDLGGGVVEVEMDIVYAPQSGGENVTEDGSFAEVGRSGHGSETF